MLFSYYNHIQTEFRQTHCLRVHSLKLIEIWKENRFDGESRTVGFGHEDLSIKSICGFIAPLPTNYDENAN